MWTGPAPMRPYNRMVHPRGWRAFMEYSNGIIGDMCIHMLDMARWMLDLGWPRASVPPAASWSTRTAKANISDTQTATFDFGDLQIVWQHRTWGEAARSKVPLGRDVLRRQRHPESQRQRLRLHPAGRRKAHPSRRHLRVRQVSRGQRPRRTWSGTSPPPSAGT